MDKLVDTTVFIDAFRKNVRAKAFLAQVFPPLFCSVITQAELIQGVRNNLEKKQINELLRTIEVLPLTPSISEAMIVLVMRYTLFHGLQIPDALIAATAMEHNLTLVTANVKHFSFIKGLKLMDWEKLAVEEGLEHL